MIPVASLLPIVNNQQKLVAILPDFLNQKDAESLQLLAVLQTEGFFNKLPQLPLFLRLSAPVQMPKDFLSDTNRHQLVLCIQESNCESEESHAQLKQLALGGYRIFVDDFDSKSSLLWELTKCLSVDCETGVSSHISSWLHRLQNYQHLARNLDTPESLQSAHDAGFNLFSGDYAFAPIGRSRSTDPATKIRLLKLLDLVSHDANSKELEALFKQDAMLSFMLFKIVSSAAFARSVKLFSFAQAISLLGRRQLQRWLQLLLYARQGDHGTALNPLMLRAAFRAGFMEGLCARAGGTREEQDCAFMVGIFSLLDLLFSCPLWEILKPLNISENVREALIDHTGVLGQQLSIVELSDRKASDALPKLIHDSDMEISTFYAQQIYAYAWVNQVCQDM